MTDGPLDGHTFDPGELRIRTLDAARYLTRALPGISDKAAAYGGYVLAQIILLDRDFKIELSADKKADAFEAVMSAAAAAEAAEIIDLMNKYGPLVEAASIVLEEDR